MLIFKLYKITYKSILANFDLLSWVLNTVNGNQNSTYYKLLNIKLDFEYS